MIVHPSLRTDVLPSARLLPSGVAIPELRSELRRIPNVRNAASVVMVWVWVAVIIAVVVRVDTWWAWLAGAVVMSSIHARLAILMHESAHNLLFRHRGANDVVGRWLVAYPTWTPISLYRRGHFAHHREEFGPYEPDMAFYSGYRTTPRALGRRLVRDAVGISGWKNLRSIVRGVRNEATRPIALSILGTQLVLAIAMWLTTGRWITWVVLWFLPWMTGWRVINRLRSIGEHGGLGHSTDRRATTHHVRQSLLARFWMVPYRTGWHLAHHVDMGVPFRNLPAFHRELERAGYVTPAMTYRSYLQLWRALASEGRPDWRPVPTVSD
jgi:fatty acid desaturase